MGAGVTFARAGAVADPGGTNDEMRKLVARGSRSSASSPSTGTEIGVLRIDGVRLKAGRSYWITSSSLLLNSSVSDDEVRARLRVATGGDTATTSSTEIALGMVADTPTSATVAAPRFPASDEELSILLTVQRTGGSGNAVVEAVAGGTHIFVHDTGPDLGNIGQSL